MNENLNKNQLNQKASKENFKYLKIDFNNAKHISILDKFYNELYIKEFTDEDEAESLENIKNQSKRIIESNIYNYHCIISILEKEHEIEIIGGIIGDYFGECNSGVIEFIVVSPNRRKKNVGSTLISTLFDYFNEDAKRKSNNILIQLIFVSLNVKILIKLIKILKILKIYVCLDIFGIKKMGIN